MNRSMKDVSLWMQKKHAKAYLQPQNYPKVERELEEPIQTVISEMQRVAPVVQQLTDIEDRLRKGAVAVEELMSKKRREFYEEMEAEREELKAENAAAVDKIEAQRKELKAEKAAAMEEIRKEREKLEEQKKAMEGVYKFQSSKVKLDIGGTKFTTSLQTLCSEPGSMLEAMFSGRHKLIQDEEGYYFIDRDGTHFRYILNYLRDGIAKEGCLPIDSQIQKELEAEADFYQLQGLLRFLEGRGLPVVAQDEVDGLFGGKLRHGRFKVAMSRIVYESKNLSGLDFSSRRFYYASFRGCILRKANFSNCLFDDRVDFTNADLRESNFENSNIRRDLFNFTGAKLDGARFSPGIKEQLGLH